MPLTIQSVYNGRLKQDVRVVMTPANMPIINLPNKARCHLRRLYVAIQNQGYPYLHQ